MENVELVIKLPKDVFKKTVFYREFRDLNDCITTIKALENAVLLPKGHGRLKDVDSIKTAFPKRLEKITVVMKCISVLERLVNILIVSGGTHSTRQKVMARNDTYLW